jgi:hypothetical protein
VPRAHSGALDGLDEEPGDAELCAMAESVVMSRWCLALRLYRVTGATATGRAIRGGNVRYLVKKAIDGRAGARRRWSR